MSLLEAAARKGVDLECCVLPGYITQQDQVEALRQHIDSHRSEDWLPIRWEVDVADEWSGWFRAIALRYNDSSGQLRVIVPNEQEPVFDGTIPLDWRVVRLRRCLDQATMALFNEIVRRSVVPIAWEVDWFRSCVPEQVESSRCHPAIPQGRWITSTARYYVPILNVLVVEDKPATCTSDSMSPLTKQYAFIRAGKNLRLLNCSDGRGMTEFESLVFDEGIRCSAEAQLTIKRRGKGAICPTCAYSQSIRSRRMSSTKPARETKASAPQCVVCMSRPPANVVLVPCGHQVLCASCLTDATKRKDSLCPICRSIVKHRLNIYLP